MVAMVVALSRERCISPVAVPMSSTTPEMGARRDVSETPSSAKP